MLKALVGLMGLSFVATAILAGPGIWSTVRGLVVPALPTGSAPLALALVGTTVVPYNLFLHSSAVRARWTRR